MNKKQEKNTGDSTDRLNGYHFPPFVLKSAILKKIRHDAMDDASVVKNWGVYTKGTLRDFVHKNDEVQTGNTVLRRMESLSRRNRTGSGPVA
uniref:Uncharacterized protein n=1 Tax=Rhipicephalus zambeziensis TaxID=60191 RepID=A0A224YL58_9ACAR